MLDVRSGQLGEEDVLRALHQRAAHHGRASERGLPERNIEHMVQTERDERALNKAVQPGAAIAGREDKAAERVDAALNHRPDIIHCDAHHQVDRR